MKLSGMVSSIRQVFFPFAIAALFAHGGVSAGTVVVTPGSLAGYTYFPAAPAASGGGSPTPGGEQDALQRCLWAPDKGDKTVTVADEFGYGKDVKLYYKLVGGNGGSGVNGGGGGSTAILLNGVPFVIGNGGNAGQTAAEKSGVIAIKKNDVLRFITGGGGGAGFWSATVSIGGGGGAGYMGGGGGASHKGANIPVAPPDVGGRGGSATPGNGGDGPGMWAGTAAIGMTGGVSTFLNGNSAPNGGASPGGGYSNYTEWNYGTVYLTYTGMRYPAGVTQGGPMGDKAYYATVAGSGGGLGNGGGGVHNTSGTSGTFSNVDLYVSTPNCMYNCSSTWYGASMARYTPHTEAMNLTRKIELPTGPSYYYAWPGASVGGQIITMYQAPTCGILK